jgi:hypothetical protein
MKRFSLLGAGLLVVLAAAAAMATSAFAVQPSNLPNTLPKTFTGKSEGETVYHSESGNVECAEASGTGEETSNEEPSGPFHIDFTKCKLSVTGGKCTGLGETTEGTILVLGTWALPFDREVGLVFRNLTTATLFLVNLVHFSCGALILIETKGSVLCLDLKQTESNATHSYHCTGGTGRAEEWCMGGEDVLGTEDMCIGQWLLAQLLESVNHATFKEATELALGNSTYGVAVTGMI